MPLPAMPRVSKRPTKKSAMPLMATAMAMTSRARIGSRSTIGESSSTQTTPAYCRKIAFAAVVHFVATTNAVRQARVADDGDDERRRRFPLPPSPDVAPEEEHQRDRGEEGAVERDFQRRSRRPP